MPQMSPLNWLTLMIIFILLFYMFNIFNYYCFLYKNNNQQKNKNLQMMNWKW